MWVSPLPKRLVERVGLVVKECSFAVNMNRDIVMYRKISENNPLIKDCVDRIIRFANDI